MQAGPSGRTAPKETHSGTSHTRLSDAAFNAVRNVLACLPYGRTVYQPSTGRMGLVYSPPDAIQVPDPADEPKSWERPPTLRWFAPHGDFVVVRTSPCLRLCHTMASRGFPGAPMVFADS